MFGRLGRALACVFMIGLGAAEAQQARDVPAGPIWHQGDAQAKCPNVCAQQRGRWNGHWRTTEHGRMSVCNCEFAQARPKQQGGWVHCADEGGVCRVPFSAVVRYGAGNSFAQRQVHDGAVECSNRVFGDPLYGTRKACYYQERGNAHVRPAPVQRAVGPGCPVPGSIRAGQPGGQANMQFGNLSHRPLKIYWIDYQGRWKFYRALNHGQSYRQPTFVNHPWVAVDGTGACIKGVHWPRFGENIVQLF